MARLNKNKNMESQEPTHSSP